MGERLLLGFYGDDFTGSADAMEALSLGHINIILAIFFGELNINFSDGAIKAMNRATSQIIQPDWRKVFEPESIRESLEEITRAP